MNSKLSAPTPKLRTPSAAPSPTPSTGSAPAGTKRKRNGPPPIPHPVNPAVHQEMMSQFNHCVSYLKEQRKEKTFEEIISYLSLGGESYLITTFERLLRESARLNYNPRTMAYSYRPNIPVTNGEELIAYLERMQRQKDAVVGARIEDIRDGWLEADDGEKLNDTLDRMEQEGKLLISRDKAKKAKIVYANEQGIFSRKIDEDFKEAWQKFPIDESSDKLRHELENAGLKAATTAKEVVPMAQPKQKRPRAPRRGGRQTNVHMQHILKDYSYKRA